MMDTITWRVRSRAELSPQWSPKRSSGDIPTKYIAGASPWPTPSRRSSGSPRAVREAWRREDCRGHGQRRQDHDQRDPGGAVGRAAGVLKSEGNFNNEYGLPLTLFKLDESHQAAVLEMGMSRRGELSRLAEIALPDVAVVTRVAPAHLEFFASVQEIALAKRELIEGLNGTESVAVLNADDPLVVAFATHAPGSVLTYGIDHPADFRAEGIEDRGALGSAFDLIPAASACAWNWRSPEGM